jgi:hypothetical protein
MQMQMQHVIGIGLVRSPRLWLPDWWLRTYSGEAGAGQELGTARTTSGPQSGNINFPTSPFLASPHNTSINSLLQLLLLLLPALYVLFAPASIVVIFSMNCPSRTEEPEGTGYNQNPSSLAPDLTTRQDLNGIANTRVLRRIAPGDIESVIDHVPEDDETAVKAKSLKDMSSSHVGIGISSSEVVELSNAEGGRGTDERREYHRTSIKWFMRLRKVMLTFGKFVGPGFMVGRPPISAPDYVSKSLSRSRWLTLILETTPQTLRLVLRTASDCSSSF